MVPRIGYPGTYVKEISSRVRIIEKVPTSISAFLGRTARGPVNVPVAIRSFADYERCFGGLWLDSTVSFAVRDFFLHGGQQAVIVRLFAPAPSGAPEPPATRARIALEGGLDLEAANEGAWGNRLRARVDHDTSGGTGDLFNLRVRDDATGQVETFRDLGTGETHPRRVDRVLARESALVRIRGPLPDSRPAASAALPASADPFDAATSTAATTMGSDGLALSAPDYLGSRDDKQGLYALEDADIFNLLCIPPYTAETDVDPAVWSEAAAYCEEKRAILLLDAPGSWDSAGRARSGLAAGVGTRSGNAALYFPRALQPNPLRGNHVEPFATCGAIAGLIAATDARVGVWKAPAGRSAALRGVHGFTVTLANAELSQLNSLGINCLRFIPSLGHMVWGARTMQGDNRSASEWKYLSVRRTALFIEESVHRGLHWVAFERNDETLWSAIRVSVDSFMNGLYRSGAFRGPSSRQAFFVNCDRETTTQSDIDRDRVNLIVGFAPHRPAEFVIVKIRKSAGTTAA